MAYSLQGRLWQQNISVNAMLFPHGLISQSNEALLQVILYGHEQLSFDSNAKILQATLE